MASRAPSFRTFRKWLLDSQGFETGFQNGMCWDTARYRIPAGSSYIINDFLVDQPGKLRKRGGCSYQSDGVNPGGSDCYFSTVFCPEFDNDDARILGIASSTGLGHQTLYDLTHPGSSTIANCNQPFENPITIFSNGQKMAILTQGTGGTVQKVTRPGAPGSLLAISDLGGSPPHGTVSASYGPYLILANDKADHENRVWFSAPGANVEADWPVAGFIDLANPITAMTALHGGVTLIWTRYEMIRILGSTPPGNVGFDQTVEVVAKIGCIDARSVVHGTNGVYFANENGVYVTDGASITSVTEGQGAGIKRIWQQLMQGFSTKLGHSVACGVFEDTWLFTTIYLKDNGIFTNVCHLPTTGWASMSQPVGGLSYAVSYATDGSQNDLYWGGKPNGLDYTIMFRAGYLFEPEETDGNEATGTPVQPLWSSRVLPGASPMLKRFGNGRLNYRMTAGGAGTLKISVRTGLDADGPLTEVHEGSPIGMTGNKIERSRFRIFKDTPGISFEVSQTGNSQETEIFGVEYEMGTFFVAEEEGEGG